MPRLLLLFLTFLFSFQLLLAQNKSVKDKKLDSLKLSFQQLSKEPVSLRRDSLIIKTIRNIWIYLPDSDTTQLSFYIKYLQSFSDNTSWNKAKAYYYYINGSTHLAKNELYSAFNNLERSLIEFRKYNDYENYMLVNNKFVPLMNWNMIANDIPNNVQARYLNYMNEAFELAKAKKDTAVWANIQITIAGYYIFVIKDYKKCYQNADAVIKLIENKNRNDWFDYYYISLLGKSLALLNMNQERKGKELLDNIIEVCQRENNRGEAKYVLSQVGAFVGRYYLEKKDYKNALYVSLIGEKNANFLNFPYYNNVLNTTLYQTYKALNQPAKAFVYLEKVKQYEEESETKKLNESFGEWQLKYEDEKQKTQIKTLENENLKRANERDDLIQNILIISLLLGLALTSYVFWNNRQLKIKNEELRVKNDEISGAMFRGQTIERKRVASELHDNLNTKIVALKWRFEALDTSKYTQQDQKILADFIQVLEDIYMDVRLISHNLLPAELESQGIAIALQKLLNNISNQHIGFHFLTEGITERFDPQLEHELYNIALELINNILKDANASQAWVSLTQQEDKISLTVSDNGKGIDLTQTANGVGLRNVHSRVENLNGKLQISKQSTHGTNVQIDVSIPGRQNA